MIDIQHTYNQWLNNAKDDVLQQLLDMKDNPKAIEDAFYKHLQFGTGGLRGVLGAGTNCMNIYSVARATMGVAKYLVNNFENPSVAIAYDSRIKSTEFALITAKVFSSFNVKVFLYDKLMPTPVLSFTVRQLNCSAGIVITASHNPKKYNGYKVYNQFGCQITDNCAKQITENIQEFGYFENYVVNESLINTIGDQVLDEFIDEISKYRINPIDQDNDLKVVYSPLNGAGNIPVRKILDKMAIKKVFVVKEQENPDGNFTTCPFPNPEIKQTLSLAVELAKKQNADLVMATDPDSDRVGIAVKDNNDYRLLNGNETGYLLADYILSQKKKNGTLLPNSYIVKTIVSGDLTNKLAKLYGVNVANVLTGFKYIGEFIDNLQDKNAFVLGMEESYGYLVGTHARDKDAVSACMMICEMACYYKSMNLTLLDRLNKLYSQFGYCYSDLVSTEYEGKSGKEQMDRVVAHLRNDKITQIANLKVNHVKDYINGIDGLPKSDVLQFIGDNFRVIVRPSGTEPKLKSYYIVSGENYQQSFELCEKIKLDMQEKLK